MDKNLLDLSGDEKLYRIFPLKYFEPMVKSGENVLVNPALWDDPFENIFMQSVSRLANGELVSLQSLREKIYGQSWSLKDESDAMWRIYSQPKTPEEGVKVCVDASSLLKSLWDAASGTRELCCFLGKIEYIDEGNLVEMLKKPSTLGGMILDVTGRGHAQSILFKRLPFDHEKEARLVFIKNNKTVPVETLYRYRLNWHDLIQEVVLDPRLTDHEENKRVKELQDLGLNCPIRRSELYVSRRFITDLDT